MKTQTHGRHPAGGVSQGAIKSARPNAIPEIPLTIRTRRVGTAVALVVPKIEQDGTARRRWRRHFRNHHLGRKRRHRNDRATEDDRQSDDTIHFQTSMKFGYCANRRPALRKLAWAVGTVTSLDTFNPQRRQVDRASRFRCKRNPVTELSERRHAFMNQGLEQMRRLAVLVVGLALTS